MPTYGPFSTATGQTAGAKETEEHDPLVDAERRVEARIAAERTPPELRRALDGTTSQVGIKAERRKGERATDEPGRRASHVEPSSDGAAGKESAHPHADCHRTRRTASHVPYRRDPRSRGLAVASSASLAGRSGARRQLAVRSGGSGTGRTPCFP